MRNEYRQGEEVGPVEEGEKGPSGRRGVAKRQGKAQLPAPKVAQPETMALSSDSQGVLAESSPSGGG